MSGGDPMTGAAAQQMTLGDVIAFLEARAKDVFDAGVFDGDEFGTYSATENAAQEFEQAAEALRDLQALICGEERP